MTVSSDPGLRFRVVDALGDLVESLATGRPLVIGLDDLQWADPSSLVTLGALARTALGMPVALIACCRPSRARRELRLFESLAHAGLRRIELGELGTSDVRDVVAEASGRLRARACWRGRRRRLGQPAVRDRAAERDVEDGSLSTHGRAGRGGESDLPPTLRLTILRRLSFAPGRGDAGAQGRVLAGVDVLDHRAGHGPGPAGHRAHPRRRGDPGLRGARRATGCCCGSATT